MDESILSMTITEELEQQLKEFPFFLEMEMLKAERQILPDGMIQYTNVEIHDENKKKIVMEFVLKMISKSHESCKN